MTMLKKVCCSCLHLSFSPAYDKHNWNCPHCGKDISKVPELAEEAEIDEEYLKLVIECRKGQEV
ncbi:hypothetical protein [Bacillus sp. FJAT-45350]|uniref:hypothetical protein n=1 Tax=Bacillus sp. FJAT-45350 TaxID=2011014 RepID=UPI000BB6A51D|nr:hypothetical protein [Bacillus sp. FJAT-45350]